ncbi:MFS transporter [Streptomyces rubiginosohelvolus]|uniref:MFS transporter n=1 Tax=Streptomyces rubiginosohelvolus TaxID=67362 RepID=UPI0036DC04DA
MTGVVSPASRPARIDAATGARLAVLAAATFVYVTFEIFPVGLIHAIAADLEATEGQVGLLVSGYAVVAGLATVPTVALATRFSRRTALTGSLAVLVLAELLAAGSTGLAMMTVSRVVAALTHGVLWSLVAPAAAALVPPGRVGTATAVVFGGASLAAVAGSPGTALLGEAVGWRITALVLAAATAAVTLALPWALGSRGAPEAPRARAGAAGLLPVRNRSAVLALCAVAVVLVTAHFVSYTYVAVILTDVAQGPWAVVPLLTVFGVAGAVGTWFVGRHNDLAPRRTATVTMSAFAAGTVGLALAQAPVPAPVGLAVAAVAVAVWGAAFAAAGPVFQTGVMRLAGSDADRASSVYVTGFQVGIAGGSALGAAMLGHAVGRLPAVSGVLGVLVLIVVLVCRPVPEVPEVPDSVSDERPPPD